MGPLVLSSTTMTDWDFNEILESGYSKDYELEIINQYNNDNYVGPYCNGLSYLEIEILNNIQ